MRIAPTTGRSGLNDEEQKGSIRTIEKRVNKVRTWIMKLKNYSTDFGMQKMVVQIDNYWGKLFADPLIVQKPEGGPLSRRIYNDAPLGRNGSCGRRP